MEFIPVLRDCSEGRSASRIWLSGHSTARLWFQGKSTYHWSASCECRECHTTIQERPSLCIRSQTPLPTPIFLPGLRTVRAFWPPDKRLVMEGWWNGRREDLRACQETGSGTYLSLVSPVIFYKNLPVHFGFLCWVTSKITILTLTFNNAGEPGFPFWLWKGEHHTMEDLGGEKCLPSHPVVEQRLWILSRLVRDSGLSGTPGRWSL